MIKRVQNKINAFLKNEKDYPILAALAAGMYPLLFIYEKNFTLLNSWQQFYFYCLIYLILPIVIFISLSFLSKKYSLLNKKKKYLIPVLNFTFFAFLLFISTYGLTKKKIGLLLVLIASLLAILFYKYYKKIVIIQLVLAAVVVPLMIIKFYNYFAYPTNWMQQPDAIEEVVFNKKPNIYIIQPDGYANFAELNKSNYSYDNSEFESFLVENDFKLYNNYRSNYSSTLSSNSSMFAMKHHYYNNPKSGMNELYNARDIIVGNNPVISIFKNNNYKTILLLEKSYLLLNRPKIVYDYSNLENKEISYLSRGYKTLKDINQDLKIAISENTETNNFYFIEKLKPGHIATFKSDSKGKINGRINYLKKLEESNTWLKQVINVINENDSNSLVVIVSDHGGFVGFDYTSQSKEKQMNKNLVYTIFTSALAIKWPGQAPSFDDKLKTNVNLFRILFSYLSDNEEYLKNLQEDKSYNIIEKGSPFGVYERINPQGEVVFKLLKKNIKK